MKKQNWNSTCLLGAVLFFWYAQYVYIPYQTPYLTAMSLGSQAVGLIVGAYGVSQLLFRLPVGVLADHGGTHKRMLVIGCCSSSLASVFRAVLDNGTGYLIGNIFSGLASAMWISFMVLYMSWFTAEEQQAASGRLVLFNNLGMLLGFVTSTLFCGLLGMRVICLCSVTAGLLALLCASGIREGRSEGTHPPVRSLLRICGNRRLIVFSLLALIQQGIQMSTTMSFTSQILRNLGAGGTIVGIASVIYMLAAVACAKFASAAACAKVGPRVWVPVIFLCVAAYCVLVPNAGSIPLVCLLQLLPGLATGILYSYLTSEAMKEVPAGQKSTAMGFYQAVYAVGMTLLPILCGRAAENVSMAFAYYLLAGLAVVGSIAGTVWYRGSRASKAGGRN